MKKLSTLAVLLCLWLAAGAQYSLIKQDINAQVGSDPVRFTSFKDKTYFIADDGIHGYEMWWSDGHSYGMAADINPGPASAFDPLPNSGHNFCVWGNSLYFAARDSALGVQLWEYNGNSAPVLRTKFKAPNPVKGYVTAVKDKLYFKVASASGSFAFLYSFDPQTHAYVSVDDPTFPTDVDPMASVGGKLLFHGKHNNVLQLVEYDPATKSYRGLNLSPHGGFYVYKNALFFLSSSIDHGRELYMYDGTSPRRITDLRQGAANSFNNMIGELTERMTVYNNKLYFMAMSAQSAPYRNLFSYDPVTNAVTEVAQLEGSSPCRGMAVYRNKLYISADSNNGQNPGLFMYDGSSLRHFSSIGLNTYTTPTYLVESNGRLFFADWDFNSPVTSFEAYVFTDSAALSAPEIAGGNGVVVYPNPATSMVQIGLSLNENAVLQVVLTDMQGRIVYSAGKKYAAGRHEIVVPVKELAVGVYNYSLANAEGVVLGRGKVVKQ